MNIKTQQTVPNIHKVLAAIRVLEDTPEVKAYLALTASLKDRDAD